MSPLIPSQHNVSTHSLPTQCLHSFLPNTMSPLIPSQPNVFTHSLPTQCLHSFLSNTMSPLIPSQHIVFGVTEVVWRHRSGLASPKWSGVTEVVLTANLTFGK